MKNFIFISFNNSKMSTKKIIVFFFLLSFINIRAQKFVEPNLDEVASAQKLKEKYEKSDIAILSSKEYISFSFNEETNLVEVNQRINENLMNINHLTEIQKHEFYDDQSVISSFSFKDKNNKKINLFVKDEYYKTDDLFYNDARVKFANLNFPVLGYTYFYEMEKKYKDVKYFTSLYFNDSYPIIDKEIIIEVPKWLDFEIKEFNFKDNSIQKVVNKGENSTFYKYIITNLKGSEVENFCPGPSFLYPHILFLGKSYTHKGASKTLFSTTADLYKWYKSLVNEIKDDPKIFSEKVKELTTQAKTDEEKIKNIYYWVQDNIRYIAFVDGIAGFKPELSQNVFEKRYGDCKGMANLTKQMLILAGFEAKLAWIGTNHIAYDYSTPSLSVDNHMICSLDYKGKRYFLDSTEKYTSLGKNAERIQGKEILIEDGESFIIDKVPLEKSDKNLETENINFYMEGEVLKGHIKVEYSGESITNFLINYNQIKNDKKEEALKNYLTSDKKNISVSNIETTDLNNRDINLTLDYDISISNLASRFDNEIYLDLNYEKPFIFYDFKERITDYQFQFKPCSNVKTTFKIPTGYKVSKLPENLKILSDDYEINMVYEVVGDTIFYTKKYNFYNGIIKSAFFEQWNKDYLLLKNHYLEQIVLSK